MPKINYKMKCTKTPSSYFRKYHEIVIVSQYSYKTVIIGQANKLDDR